MANSPTAKKMILVHEKRRRRNQHVRTMVKNAMRKTHEALAAGEGAAEAFRHASSLVDKSVTKGVMHKNKAARKKSRLARKINKAQA